MSQASLVINVSEEDHQHSNGLSGTWVVPGRKKDEKFALLVVYPTPEIQDIGSQKRTVHWLKAAPLAKDIVGLRSDAAAHGLGIIGSKEKWGLLLCKAEPDVPKDLEQAIETEMEFLNHNMPDVKYKRDADTGASVAINVEDIEVKKQKIKLAEHVWNLRLHFEEECRALVSQAEIMKAKRNLLTEDQRLVGEGDRMFASVKEQQNINEIHRRACARLGQTRPWCYTPQQLVECPGCGAMIKENTLRCSECNAIFDDELEVLRSLSRRERFARLYPDQVADVPAVGGRKA